MATYEKFASPEQDEPTPCHTVNQSSCGDICRSGYAISVGQERVSHNAGPCMTDDERESAITRAARAMEHHMAEVSAINARTPHVFSDFVDASASRWMADRARRLMEQLIAGRSAEYVAKLEEQRGLR